MEMQNLTTDRLLLRPPTMADAQAIFDEYAQDPEATRYLTWRPHTDVEETRRYLRSCEAGWAEGSRLAWALTQRGSGDVIGMVGCKPKGHQATLGYVLRRADWGKGYMPEAASAVVGWLFSIPEIYRVWATCDIENTASARVLEKLGMTREGILRRWIVHPNVSCEPRDSFVYAKVR